MITCNICGIQKETPRSMHGHLIRWHYDEYKAVDFKQAELTTSDINHEKLKDTAAKKKKKVEKVIEVPAGFRLLNNNNREEKFAISEGYYFIDNEGMCYTFDEAKNEGWV